MGSLTKKKLAIFAKVSLLGIAICAIPGVTSSASSDCLAIPEHVVPFGKVSKASMQKWFPGLRYATNVHRLSIENGLVGGRSIRQLFVPTENGSERVLAGFEIAPASTYSLIQTIRFNNDFDWGGKYEVGKVGFGLGGGSVPSGGETRHDGFSARLVWLGDNRGEASLAAYVYSADRDQNLPFGDVYKVEGFTIIPDEWFEVELVVTVNSDLNTANGSLVVVVNDEIRFQRDNILWQKSGNQPVVDEMTYASFYGGNSSEFSPELTTDANIANVCLNALQ